MAQPRFYLPLALAAGQAVALDPERARHAVSVLRLREGDRVCLFNGDGREFHGCLFRDGKILGVQLDAEHAPRRESPLAVTLVQGISSGDRMDYTLQKAVELGVQAIVPIFTKRSVVRLSDERLARRHTHWQNVVSAACEQCGRNVIPEVSAPQDFAPWLEQTRPQRPLSHTLLLDPEAEQTLRDRPAPGAPLTLLAGPEGGFDPGERHALLAAGCTGVRLGPRILRTETAAVAALAALQALWGDF